jgi:hypothetical protein
MPRSALDHLVVAATTLDEGVSWLEDKFGIRIPAGGRHPLMGTHNCLMQIGGGAFLEIVAIDPDADAPGRPRWYSLDHPETQAQLADGPRLLTWVVRTPDITGAAGASLIPCGPVNAGRRGTLVWEITVPHDGSMPEGGLFPTLIRWPASLGPEGPIPDMPDLGCRLEDFRIVHRDPERFQAALASIGAEGAARVEQAGDSNPPGLKARFGSPKGKVAIG